MPALASRRARYSAEALIAVLLVEAGRLERVRVQVNQAAAAPPRAALGLLDEPAAESRLARSRREPEQFYIALSPVRQQDQPAQQSSFAVPRSEERRVGKEWSS